MNKIWTNKFTGAQISIDMVEYHPRGGGISRKMSFDNLMSEFTPFDENADVKFIKGLFAFKDEKPLVGWFDPNDRWNGWAKPWFDVQTAVGIAETCGHTFEITPDSIIIRGNEHDDPDIYPFEVKKFDEDEVKVCQIGAGWWVWSYCGPYIWGHRPSINEIVEKMKREIVIDMRDNTMPTTVRSFSELHDHVDANCYGGAEQLHYMIESQEELLKILNRAQLLVDHWLGQGLHLSELQWSTDHAKV